MALWRVLHRIGSFDDLCFRNVTVVGVEKLEPPRHHRAMWHACIHSDGSADAAHRCSQSSPVEMHCSGITDFAVRLGNWVHRPCDCMGT